MKRLSAIMALAVAFLLMTNLNAWASSIHGGVSDADLMDRPEIDGASGINFIDLSNPINGDGLITSWSIYAKGNDDDAKMVGLIIFRSNGTDYDVVGKSPLETITMGGWNQRHTFTDLGGGISVKAGDYLGWYYPPQNGGVIAFSNEGDDVHWVEPYYPAEGQPEATTPWMYNSGRARTYSINVSGTTAPAPATLVLLGSGLLMLLGAGWRLKKS